MNRGARRPVALVALALAAIVSTLAGVATPSVARADAQLSSRLGIGGGARRLDDGSIDGRFEMLLRAEALFGPARPDAFRVGPALDFRTGDFASAELAGGLAVLAPIAGGWPLWLTLGAGYAARDDGPSGPIGLATLAFGYRGYDYHDAYGYAVDVYVTTRVDLDEPGRFEITAGLAVDLAILLVLPTMALITWIRGGDPDE